MSEHSNLNSLAERAHRLTKDLLRKYQMRDRNEIICCGISVSQCYALDVLGEHGEIPMAQLARSLFLDKSTCTRVVDQLVKRELAVRSFSDADRREVLVKLTPAGERLREQILADQLESQRQILARIPAAKRPQVIETMELLSGAIHHWLATCCVPGKVQIPEEE